MAWKDVALADSPSVLLEMQETSGSLIDTQVGNDATLSGAAVTYRVPGPGPGLPYGVRFQNTSLATIANSADVKFGDGPVSVELWFKQTTAGAGSYRPILMGDQATAPGYSVLVTNTNRVAWQNGATTNIVWTPTGLVDAVWHHIIITRGLVVDDGLIWYDSVQQGTPVTTVTFSDSTLACILGNDFTGDLAGFAIYKAVLTPEQVRYHYLAGAILTPSLSSPPPRTVGFGVPGRGIFHPRSYPDQSIAGAAPQNLSLTADDTFAFSDAVTRQGTFLRTLADSVTYGNAVTRLGTFLRTATDGLGFGDAVARLVTLTRTAADSLAIGNTVARVGTFLRTASDALGFSDAVVRVGTFLRTAADSLSFADAIAGVRLIVRTAADALGFADAVSRVGTFTRTAADSLSMGNAVTRLGTFLRSTADSLSLGNTVTRVGTFLRTASDTLGFSDAIGYIITGGQTVIRTMTDSLAIGNTVSRLGTFTRTAAQSLSFSDVVAAIKSGPGVIGGIARQTATAVHAIPGVITSHLRPSGGASNVTPPAGSSHGKPDGEADHEVPE